MNKERFRDEGGEIDEGHEWIALSFNKDVKNLADGISKMLETQEKGGKIADNENIRFNLRNLDSHIIHLQEEILRLDPDENDTGLLILKRDLEIAKTKTLPSLQGRYDALEK